MQQNESAKKGINLEDKSELGALYYDTEQAEF